MAVIPPTIGEIESVARELGLQLDPKDRESYANLMAPFLLSFAYLDSVPDELPPVRYPRTPGERPLPEENPLGAWYVKTHIEGAPGGKLAGRTVALKDNVMLAGVPMMNGTALLDGFVPPIDATIATRILDAGATIAGKAVCEAYCVSGGSHTADTGHVRNPHDLERSAGGSSSGSAALVAAGEVDMAIGCDQGGSIRMPASFCGIVGMKATHGLVPYTGIIGMDATIDHVGPMTANVADNALLLEVIAGADGLDGRQNAPRTSAYTEALGQGCQDLRIGVLREGFGLPGSEPDVDEKVRAAADRLATLGAKVTEVAVPLHTRAPMMTAPIFLSAIATMLGTDGCSPGREDVFVPSLIDHLRGWRQRAGELPETIKVFAVCAKIAEQRYGWRYYAKAMNLVRRVRAAYDEALQEVDLLLMPTTPIKATRLPPQNASREEILSAAFAPIGNTQPFDHSHHPALSLPCGLSGGLPIGMMLVGRPWEEATLYRAAQAFEQHEDWKSL